MIKEVSFGKVDGYGTGRRNCEIVLEVGFREFPGQEPYFTVCANLWNHIHSDIIMGGQCIDTLREQYKGLAKNRTYTEISDFWKKYHLKKISTIPTADVDAINDMLEKLPERR